ncbi:MAG TPA: ferrochelatase [Candidatus Omnitrophota bacterium]|nr:ferrochelatase [Candidatus Omnitrophota bacterium]
MKKGVLLINLGTPDSPSVADVRKYLREFLMDGRVIDIPWLNRFFLVNGVIAPLRAVSSSKAYHHLWTSDGSPLKYYGIRVKEMLQESLGTEYTVSLGMRYQNPSLRAALDKLKKENVGEITVIPLYPQYASASTGSTIEKVFDELKNWEIIPSMRCISQFFDHPRFIKAFARKGEEHLKNRQYDHVLFSYHGLPERQILKASRERYCQLNEKCCRSYHVKNQFCYRAQCFETSRLLAKALNLEINRYSVSFQSRLGKEPWIKPYTDEIIKELAARGYKRVLCFSPSFIADCLETTVEIGMEYKNLFLSLGGERWDLVESLNDSPTWIECLKALILEAKPESVMTANAPY